MDQFRMYKQPGSQGRKDNTIRYKGPGMQLENGLIYGAIVAITCSAALAAYWAYDTHCNDQKRPVLQSGTSVNVQKKLLEKEETNLESCVEIIIETQAGKEESERK